MKKLFKKFLLPGAILFCGIAIYGIISFVGADELSGTDPVIQSGADTTLQTGDGAIVYQPLQWPDRATIYGTVFSALESSGIHNNLNNVTNDNVTNFPYLTFFPGYGMLEFQTGLDLTDPDTQSFLETLPNNLSMTNGYLDFNPTGNGSGLNIPARLFFYLDIPPFIGTGYAVDYVTARDNNNTILSGINLDGLFANDGIIHCDMGEWYYCEFYVNHFTSFELFTPPAPGVLPYHEGDAPTGFVKLVDDIHNPQYMVYMRESPVNENWYSYAEMQSYVPNENEALPTTTLMNILISSNHSTTWVVESGIMQDLGNRPDWVSDATWDAWYNLFSVNNDIEVGGQPAVSQWPYVVAWDWVSSARIRTIYTTYYDAPTPFSCDNVTDVSTQECNALVDLYTATNGDNWDDSDGWLMSYNVCDRYGVTCEDNHVTNIELEENSLDGNIPGSISGLQYLQGLDIYDNSVTSLPDSLWTLSNLTSLEFSDNLLTSLPDSIGNLTELTEIYGYGNHLTTLPDSISKLSSLNTLDVSDNRLSSIDLSWLNSIQYLFFNENLLTTLGDDIINFDLDNLAVDNNCRDISSISTGTIDWLNSYYDNTDRQTITNPVCNDDPDEVAALTDLYYATDGPNSWDTNTNWLDRSVSMCTWYGVDCRGWTTVRWLILKDNYLSGAIPESFGNLTHLNRVNMQYNNITSLPTSIWTLSGINVLVLDHNSLTSIPASISGLVNLGQLSIQNNYIRTLPESIWGLHYLMRFFFNDNYLTTLPDTFTYDNLSNLNSSYFDMANNCIWEWRLASGVNDFLNSMEIDRWKQTNNCPAWSFIETSLDTETIYAPITFVYDYTATWASFTDDWFARLEWGMGTNWLNFSTHGFTINVLSGDWDGLLYAPNPFTDPTLGERNLPPTTGTNGNTTTIRHIAATVQAWASGASLWAEGWLFTIIIAVDETYSGQTLHIYRSSDWWLSWIANTPDATCDVVRSEFNPEWQRPSDHTCTFQTDHLSYFTTVEETTTTSNGGNGGWVSTKDNCPNGDTSLSYYDGKCSLTTPTNWATSNTGSLVGSPFTDEINNAYLYAYNLGITSSPTILGADIEWKLIRSHMAKMMVNYAVKVMWLKPDTTKACVFSDVANETPELQGYMKLACQLWIMGINPDGTAKEIFMPNAVVTRAEFGTVLSRVLRWDKYNLWTLYYTNHLQALKDAGIMTNILNPEWTLELRGRVMLMLMRANK